MITVIGSVIAKPGEEASVRDLSLVHVKRSQAEPGCLSHAVTVDCENPQRFVFVEHWQDMPALQVHFDLAESKAFVRDLTPHLAEPPVMKIYATNEIER